MIFVDTNVIIDFWHKPTADMTRRLYGADIVVCGVVRTELLHGSHTVDEYERIARNLSGFASMSLENADWDAVGYLLFVLKRHGLSVPLADAIIAYLAIKNDGQVWTSDRHFVLIREIMPQLHLAGGAL